MDEQTLRFYATRSAVTKALLSQLLQVITGGLLVFMSQWDQVYQGFQIFFLIAGIFVLATAILVIGLTLAQRGRPVLGLHPDHLRVGRQEIPYDRIQSLQTRSARQVLLHYTRDGETRRLRLPVGVLTDTDRTAFLGELERRIPA